MLQPEWCNGLNASPIAKWPSLWLAHWRVRKGQALLITVLTMLAGLPVHVSANIDQAGVQPALNTEISSPPTADVTPVLKRLHELYGGFSGEQGYMAWPVAGPYRISSHFGTRHHPISKKRRFHHGLDIAAPRGTPIVSVAPGRVSFAGWRRGFGRVVEVEHGQGWVSRYAHAKKITVKKGQFVLAGQVVGQVGRSGHATGAHLHLEIERSGKRVNPMTFWAGIEPASPQ
jgi:murein DD-endopeptidase MepM/ murein hydrolase activator NlpD